MNIKYLGRTIIHGEVDDVIPLIDEAVARLQRQGVNVEYALCEYCAAQHCPWCEPGSVVVETESDEQVDVIGFCIDHQRQVAFNTEALYEA